MLSPLLFLRYHPKLLAGVDLGSNTQAIQAEEIVEVHPVFLSDLERGVSTLHGIQNRSLWSAGMND